MFSEISEVTGRYMAPEEVLVGFQRHFRKLQRIPSTFQRHYAGATLVFSEVSEGFRYVIWSTRAILGVFGGLSGSFSGFQRFSVALQLGFQWNHIRYTRGGFQ